MASCIVSLIAWRQLGQACQIKNVPCSNAAYLLCAVNKGQKLILRQNNLFHFVSVAENCRIVHPVVTRLRLSKILKSGKMQTIPCILLVLSWFVQFADFNHSQDRFWWDVAKIHLRSLIGVCTCMCVYMNSAGLDEQSELGISKLLQKKKCICKKRHLQIVCLITKCFISEHRKSHDRKTSA